MSEERSTTCQGLICAQKFCFCMYSPFFPQSDNLTWACDLIENQYQISVTFRKKKQNKTKHATTISTKPELKIWSRDTSQRIPCFDSCQLTITWIFNIKYVPMVMALLPYLSRYGAWCTDSHVTTKLFLDRSVWGFAPAPTALRSSSKNHSTVRKLTKCWDVTPPR